MMETDETDNIIEGIEKKEYLHILWQMFKDLYETQNESAIYQMNREQINLLITCIGSLKLELPDDCSNIKDFRKKLKNPDYYTETKAGVIGVILDEIKKLTPETMGSTIIKEILQEEDFKKNAEGGNIVGME